MDHFSGLLQQGALSHHPLIEERAAVGTFSGRFAWLAAGLLLTLGILPSGAAAQDNAPSESASSTVQLVHLPPQGQPGPPISITLKEALERAQKSDPTFFAAGRDAKSAHEDSVQAKALLLPEFQYSTQYLNTQGGATGTGGTTTIGKYVTNDGVHVYRAWLMMHQDLSPGTFMATGYHRATAAEALANAKAEIAGRGLAVTVTKLYYTLVVAQRKYATAKKVLDQAQQLFELRSTQVTEPVGEESHSDVGKKGTDSPRQAADPAKEAADKDEEVDPRDALKAEIQLRQQEQAFEEAELAIEDARLDLSVVLFSVPNENFTVVDDLDSVQELPQFSEMQTMAAKQNPDVRAAMETVHEADLDVTAAKTAFLPTLTVDVDEGIEANAFALYSRNVEFPEKGVLPNLGYFLTANLTVPVWNWGALKSKLKQAEYKRQEVRVALTQTQRQDLSELYAAYNEAVVAHAALDKLKRTVDLAAESLRLVNLPSKGGEPVEVDQVVDAQAMLAATRGAYDDGQIRYRLALANLQLLTGKF